ncbi:hypothetical protein NDU88_004880 [Pleurodeles waltl]|uniref:Uncharacterized protein n=1 Tax=Pleurodeles waltl TaxID=8319 RepID=A0AAV7TTS1_PLEWA|nr:hypothetical protein NDU88_004880 [Pleurodeles waltl]
MHADTWTIARRDTHRLGCEMGSSPFSTVPLLATGTDRVPQPERGCPQAALSGPGSGEKRAAVPGSGSSYRHAAIHNQDCGYRQTEPGPWIRTDGNPWPWLWLRTNTSPDRAGATNINPQPVCG